MWIVFALTLSCSDGPTLPSSPGADIDLTYITTPNTGLPCSTAGDCADDNPCADDQRRADGCVYLTYTVWRSS